MDSGKPTPNQAAATTYRHCFACRHFHVGKAQCRRWPPDAHPTTGEIGWPRVEADDWCGEFEARETPQRFWPPGPLEQTNPKTRAEPRTVGSIQMHVASGRRSLWAQPAIIVAMLTGAVVLGSTAGAIFLSRFL